MDRFPSRILAAAITLALAGVAGVAFPSSASPSPNDPPLVQIHQIQNAGLQSDYEGWPVTIEGIVTAVKQDGFFLQAPDDEADNSDWTSEGIFVFTGSSVPTAAQVGYRLRVSGTVAEHLTDPMSTQSYRTQIEPVWSVTRLTESPVALPAPARLDRLPNTPIYDNNLEPYEGMRVIMPEMTVSTATGGNFDESTGSIISSGLFYTTNQLSWLVSRQPGIYEWDRLPVPSDPSLQIPRWHSPEITFAVNSTLLGHAPIDVSVEGTVQNLTAILDEDQHYYTLLVEPGSQESIGLGQSPHAMGSAPPEDALRLAHLALDRFFDATDSADIAEPVLSQATFDQRLEKAALAVRQYLSGEHGQSAPHIIGVTGVEDLNTLQALADKIGSRYFPYSAHLIKGNDPKGLNIGYLLRKDEAAWYVPRTQLNSIAQIGKDALLTLPDGTSIPLYDHPPLIMETMAYVSGTKATPITTILVDLLPEEGANTDTALGERVRLQRQRQAEYLAGYVQARQQANPSIRLAVLGQFNAPQFNDGLADVLGTIMGTPSPDNTTVIPGDGRDLVTTDLSNADPLFPNRPYYLDTTWVRGYSQKLNHLLASEGLVLASESVWPQKASITANFPANTANDANSPSGLSRHDPIAADFLFRREALMDYAEVGFDPLPWDTTTLRAGDTLDIPVRAFSHSSVQNPQVAVGFAFDASLPTLKVIPDNPNWSCNTSVVTAEHTSVGCHSTNAAAGMSGFRVEAETTPDMASRTMHFVSTIHLGPVHDPDPSNNEVGMSIRLF